MHVASSDRQHKHVLFVWTCVMATTSGGKVRTMSNLEQQLERLLPAASLSHICFPERESLLVEES